jgi:outer membrane biogenesis lipoprotein LolB
MDTVQLKKIAPACAVLVLLTACTSSQERRAQENGAVRTKAAQEIHRICSLPGPEREAEIKRVKEESGMAISCGSQ